MTKPQGPKYQRALLWIRRDLRLHDHIALSEVSHSSEKYAVVFVFDTTILDKISNKADRRIQFIHDSLTELDAELRARGSALIVRIGDPRDEIPLVAKKLRAEAVFTNHDYEPKAIARDRAVEKSLRAEKIGFHTFKDQVIFEKREILTGSGTPYKVFTPYKNTWLGKLSPNYYLDYHTNWKSLWPEADFAGNSISSADWSLKKLGFNGASLWLKAGAKAGKKRLADFREHISQYKKARDVPAHEGTSGLSVHLRFGTISIREAVRLAVDSTGEGATTWLSELIWRDFYHMILAEFPHVDGKSFKPEFENIKWPGKKEHFEAWCKGMTGFPIVDAAMRHFNDTGWMHNRLRMVVASFLVKDLLIDWRHGEKYFADHLLDFDLAANNGGWQWSASTGCDAQPYFRIFNPTSQSERFDPDGKFIRAHVDELAKVSAHEIHSPNTHDLFSSARGYPAPIVDHSIQRDKALRLFAEAKK